MFYKLAHSTALLIQSQNFYIYEHVRTVTLMQPLTLAHMVVNPILYIRSWLIVDRLNGSCLVLKLAD